MKNKINNQQLVAFILSALRDKRTSSALLYAVVTPASVSLSRFDRTIRELRERELLTTDASGLLALTIDGRKAADEIESAVVLEELLDECKREKLDVASCRRVAVALLTLAANTARCVLPTLYSYDDAVLAAMRGCESRLLDVVVRKLFECKLLKEDPNKTDVGQLTLEGTLVASRVALISHKSEKAIAGMKLVEKAEKRAARFAKKPTIDAVLDAAQRDDLTGFCFACGVECDGVEDDARDYKCDSCGATAVFGAGEALLMLGGDSAVEVFENEQREKAAIAESQIEPCECDECDKRRSDADNLQQIAEPNASEVGVVLPPPHAHVAQQRVVDRLVTTSDRQQAAHEHHEREIESYRERTRETAQRSLSQLDAQIRRGPQ